MHRFVGKKAPQAPTPSLGDAEKTLTGRQDALEDKIRKLDKELLQYKTQLKGAKGSAAENLKRRALDVLKRKRMLEKQRDNVATQAFNVGQTAFAIDTMKTTKDTIKAMQVGAKEMKKELKTLDIDKIEDLQDDFQDYMEEFEEMNEVMGRAWGVPNDVDETDLDAELAGLDEEILLEEEQGAGEVTLPDYLKTPDMPAAPRTQVPDEHAKAEVI